MPQLLKAVGDQCQQWNHPGELETLDFPWDLFTISQKSLE